jgi:hypothetical protein
MSDLLRRLPKVTSTRLILEKKDDIDAMILLCVGVNASEAPLSRGFGLEYMPPLA